MSNFKLDPNFEAALTADLRPRLERAGDSLAASLRENISAGQRTGRKYSGLPRRSSAAHEFPQEQHGDLVDSVHNNPTNTDLVREVGFFGDKQGKLNALEFGNEPGGLTARAPLARTLENEDVQRAATEAMR